MTLRVGTATQIERNPRDLAGAVPVEAYWMDHPSVAGAYVLGTGDKDGEATAFLKETSPGVFVLDDDPAEEDRKMYLVNSNVVIV